MLLPVWGMLDGVATPDVIDDFVPMFDDLTPFLDQLESALANLGSARQWTRSDRGALSFVVGNQPSIAKFCRLHEVSYDLGERFSSVQAANECLAPA